jgi:ubiquinone/menaquinone biosynthesis C-methylase UbiE
MFSDPVKNLRAFGLRDDHIVADLGAGTGFYSLAAGRMVPRGKVYAVDIIKDFLATILTRVKEIPLDNVEILWGNIEKKGGTKIGDNIVDAVIASNILFQLEHKERFIDETKRILKNGGRVLLIDWIPESSGVAPVVNLKMAVPKHKAQEMFEAKGFILEQDINAGTHHYGMILIKQ